MTASFLEVGMTIDQVLNTILFIFSGFFFGIFASRYSVKATGRIMLAKMDQGWSADLVWRSLPNLVFLVIAFFIFPIWFSTKTLVGAFVFYAVLLFYYSKGWKKLRAAQKEDETQIEKMKTEQQQHKKEREKNFPQSKNLPSKKVKTKAPI